jgi:prophage tail gpP-like protein
VAERSLKTEPGGAPPCSFFADADMTFTDVVISQPSEPGTNPDEIAEIVVLGGGRGGPGAGVFSDWETVWLQVRWMDAWPVFRFTAAERDPIEKLWSRLQIKPDDNVVIHLGGNLALTGLVTIRQTAYDANSHAVSIQGVGVQWLTWRGAILDEKQEFPGSYVDVAKQVLAPFGVKPVVIGDIDPTPFKPPAHNEIGESVFQFLEKLGRERKVVLGADYTGSLLFIGEHVSDTVDELTEGDNILSCQCVLKMDNLYNPNVVRSQSMRSDEGSPRQAAHQEAYVNSAVLKRYSPLLVANEHPVWTKHEVDLRAETEAKWNDGDFIEATVVVYGWFTRRDHVLWAQLVGQSVILNSPMTTLVGEKMAIRSVTSTQDRQSGTRTTLDLCAPWLLNDKSIRLDTSQIPAEPGKAQSTPNSPAVTGDPNQNRPTVQ